MNPFLQAEKVIDSWRQWKIDLTCRPGISKPLTGGLSNHTFLLEASGRKMVLRIYNSRPLPGINRKQEIEIWAAASHAGIAPDLLFADHQQKFMLSTFIENHPDGNTGEDIEKFDQVFSLMVRSHQLDADVRTIHYTDHIDHYWKLLDASSQPARPALYDQKIQMYELAEYLQNDPGSMGLCHHDPVVANFVGDKRLYLIDWEYAARGHFIMDWAALAVEWGFSDEVMQTRVNIDLQLLDKAKQFYLYLCALWSETNAL